MSTEKARIASALHQAADLLIAHENTPESLDSARELIEEANAMLVQGPVRSIEDRGIQFASHMVAEYGAIVPEEGEEFVAFDASPYSGAANALRPRSIIYRRVGNEVHADVLLGIALEGFPGRAHGGATAAVFDDIMGSIQRVVNLYGFTRTLEVTYRAPLPTNETVLFRCWLTESTDRTFTVLGEAVHDDVTVATAVGVFTSFSLDRFVGES